MYKYYKQYRRSMTVFAAFKLANQVWHHGFSNKLARSST